MLSDHEAQMMAGAITEIVDHYGFAPKGPQMMWFNLAAVAGMIYIPRMIAISATRKEERRKRAAATGDIPPGPAMTTQQPQNGTMVYEMGPTIKAMGHA